MATIYSTGFESGSLPAGWSTFSPTGKTTTWAVGVPNASTNAPATAYAGSYVCATNPTGNHDTDEESVLDWVLPDLTYYSGVSASWAGWLDLVATTGTGAQIHLSTDGGATFTGVAGTHLSPGYNTTATTGGGVILSTIGRWTGLAPGSWTLRTFDLEAALGASPRDQVVIRFAFEGRPSFAGRAGWYLDSVSLDGTSTDVTGPTVTITSSSTGTGTPYIVTGTAADSGSGVALVEARVASGSWETASGTTSWSHPLTISMGSSLIEARAQDASGNYSDVASLTVTWDPDPRDRWDPRVVGLSEVTDGWEAGNGRISVALQSSGAQSDLYVANRTSAAEVWSALLTRVRTDLGGANPEAWEAWADATGKLTIVGPEAFTLFFSTSVVRTGAGYSAGTYQYQLQYTGQSAHPGATAYGLDIIADGAPLITLAENTPVSDGSAAPSTHWAGGSVTLRIYDLTMTTALSRRTMVGKVYDIYGFQRILGRIQVRAHRVIRRGHHAGVPIVVTELDCEAVTS